MVWSILEVVCHLYDEEREDFREHLDFILYRQSEEWHRIDPKGWVTERRYNEQDFAESQAKFFEERKKSLEWLKGLFSANCDTTYTSQFGSMRAGDMFASWVAHDNLHIRELVELRRNHIERITKLNNIEYAGEWEIKKEESQKLTFLFFSSREAILWESPPVSSHPPP